ncbi:Myb domain protein 4r1 [Favolaschia claudopus]|uniref:Myb domain protein 4r1 n=1 Tax=Favolaschia claudopus TaxID=2862362 RepID=A0AAW0EAZ6_9AGAR
MSFRRPTPKELAVQAFQANQAHQYALAQHAEKLTTELAELDRLLALANTDDGESDIDSDFYIPNSKPPVGFIRNFSNPDSPFYEDTMKRNRYLGFTVRHSVPAKEIEALKAAVNTELRRVEQLEGTSSTTTDAQMGDKLNWTVIAEKVSDSSSVKRTAEECKIKWIGDLSSSTNRREWSAPETQQLKDIIAKQPNRTSINWVEVSRELGTNRLPLDCMRQSIDRPRHIWNAESDQRLKDAVKLYGTAWSLVARYVSPELTAHQCSTRYLRVLDPTLRHGPWTAEEDKRLTEAVGGYGRSAWSEIASTIPGRVSENCRDRWLTALDPMRTGKTGKKSNDWSDEKDRNALIDAVQTHGKNWKVIAVQFGRSATSCRQQYETLMKLGYTTNPDVQPLALDSSSTPNENGVEEQAAISTSVAPVSIVPSQTVASSSASTPARPRPRALAKTKSTGSEAAHHEIAAPSVGEGNKRLAPEPEDTPPHKKQAVEATEGRSQKAMIEPVERTTPAPSTDEAPTTSEAVGTSPRRGGRGRRRAPQTTNLPLRRSSRLGSSALADE